MAGKNQKGSKVEVAEAVVQESTVEEKEPTVEEKEPTVEEKEPAQGVADGAVSKYATVYGGLMIDPDSHTRYDGVPKEGPMTGWLKAAIAAKAVYEVKE